MELNILSEESYCIISIKGDLDAVSAIDLDNALEDTIHKQNKDKILIDCTQLDYISSPGIGVFTSRIAETEEKSIKIVLFGLNAKVLNVFNILGLDSLIPMVSSKEIAKSVVEDGV